MNLVFITAFGGAIGAWFRFLIGTFISKRFSRLPVAMILVNVIGAFGLGVYTGSYLNSDLVVNESMLHHFIGIGFFGAFTTFSTFSVEAVQLLQQKKTKSALIYMVSTIFGSILLFSFGVLCVI
ncbi:fluoride efflux transporter CrcB [Bacillus solimangrovi]|uniref:Fluoride-specific ion channel FluC n=1 Tax=Bacillus solimangrovi TaxID=1305675 RepID=A0A1E5LJH7_9BACI|nr:fluoride efflux transporter CrcB [Bacillus solimangrovi]OEH94221.1 hypothetical protein BFG57_09225 [Bacillus solimangrovi]